MKKKYDFKLKFIFLIFFLITNISFADTKSFTFTGSDESWSVPTGTKSITIEGYGAAGGTGGNSGGAGGKGGYLKATISVSAGDTLTIRIGQKGHNGVESSFATSTVFGNGGKGGGGAPIGGFQGGAGGGTTYVKKSSTNLFVIGYLRNCADVLEVDINPLLDDYDLEEQQKASMAIDLAEHTETNRRYIFNLEKHQLQWLLCSFVAALVVILTLFLFLVGQNAQKSDDVIDQLEQFLRALGRQRSVCSLSDVGCRMELSCAPKARIHVLQAPALMTTFLTPSRQRTPLLGAPAVLLRNSCCKSGVFTPRRMPHSHECMAPRTFQTIVTTTHRRHLLHWSSRRTTTTTKTGRHSRSVRPSSCRSARNRTWRHVL